MMNECETYEPMIADALGGELSANDRPAFDAHLSACDRCRRDYESSANTLRNLRSNLSVPQPSRMTATVLQRTSARDSRNTILRYAAAIALAFTAGYVWNRPAPNNPENPTISQNAPSANNSIRDRLAIAHRADPLASEFAISLRAIIGSGLRH